MLTTNQVKSMIYDVNKITNQKKGIDMTVKRAILGQDLIKVLLELTGKEYSKLVTGVTVTASMNDAVTVEVRMLAEDTKKPNAD